MTERFSPDLSANPGLIYMAKTHQENGMGEQEFLMLALTAGYDKPPGVAKASWDAALSDDTPDAADLDLRTPLNWQKKYQALRSWADGAKVDIDGLEDEVKRLRAALTVIANQDYRGNRPVSAVIAFDALTKPEAFTSIAGGGE